MKRILIIIFFITVLKNITLSQQVDFLRTYVGTGYSSYCYDFIVTSDKKCLLVGTDWLFHGEHNSLLIKTDIDGNMIWRRIDTVLAVDNEAFFVTETANGDYLIGGVNYGSDRSSFALRYDTAGNLIWKKTFASTGQNIRVTTAVEINSKIYFIGIRDSNNVGNGFLLTTDEHGDTIDCKLSVPFIPGTTSLSALPYDNDKIIIAGTGFDSTSMLYVPQITVIDTSSIISWQSIYPTSLSSAAQQLHQVPGGFIFTSFGVPGGDYIHKIDSLGNVIWGGILNTPYPNALCNIDSNTFMIGYANVSLQWRNGAGNVVSNEFITMPNGGEVSRASFVNGKVFIAGSMITSSNPFQGVAYFLKISDTNIVTSTTPHPNHTALSHEPFLYSASKELHLYDDALKDPEIIVADASGRQLFHFIERTMTTSDYTIELPSFLSSGIYIIKVISGKRNYYLKYYHVGD